MTTTEPRAPHTTELLTDEMLARFDERAPIYDRENRFFDEDFAELRESGYLLAAVPTEYGRRGLGLDEYSQLARRLAYVAPATALAVNMHVYWTGVAADLLRRWRRLVPLDPREGRRRRGVRRDPRRGRQRHPAAAVDRSGRARRRRLVDQRPQDLRQPDAGVDLRRLPRDGHAPIPPRRRIVHGFLPARHARARDRRHLGHARDACDPEPGHGARQGVRARRARARWCARPGFAGAGPFQVAIFAWALLGFAAGLPRRGQAGLRHHVGQDADSARRSP